MTSDTYNINNHENPEITILEYVNMRVHTIMTTTELAYQVKGVTFDSINPFLQEPHQIQQTVIQFMKTLQKR